MGCNFIAALQAAIDQFKSTAWAVRALLTIQAVFIPSRLVIVARHRRRQPKHDRNTRKWSAHISPHDIRGLAGRGIASAQDGRGHPQAIAIDAQSAAMTHPSPK